MGVSHRTAPIALLEKLSLDGNQLERLTSSLLAGEHVEEVATLATCNRLEVYAESSTFHGAVADIGQAVADATGVDRDDLNDAFYVLYEDRAVAHLFSVACGLDAMAVGEGQILGQLRDSLGRGQSSGTVGPHLNLLMQHALRVGKRAHADTDLDRYASSLVDVGLAAAEAHVGPLRDASVVVVGAGAMSSLVATTVSRQGARSLTIVNRTPHRSARLAEATEARTRPWSELFAAVAEADVVLSCTGAAGHVILAPQVSEALAGRPGRPLALVDLALPRDIDPDVNDLPGCRLLALEDLGRELAEASIGGETLREVEDLVVSEVASFLVTRRQESVGPAVAALRRQAAAVVRSELDRFVGRVPDVDPRVQAEVERTVHRVVEKLLHTPTVRVKELTANGSGTGGDYARALRELFDLDHAQVASVSRPPERGGTADLP